MAVQFFPHYKSGQCGVDSGVEKQLGIGVRVMNLQI